MEFCQLGRLVCVISRLIMTKDLRSREQKTLLLSGESNLEVRLAEPIIPIPPWPDLKKSLVQIGRFDQKK